MKILINCSNLKKGGGVQVADSVCCQLLRYPQHYFIVVLSSYMDNTNERLVGVENVEVVRHDIKNSLKTLIFGRDRVLDRLVADNDVEVVLTIFGPSRWNPRIPHLSGFAMPHCVLPDSPYFTRMGLFERVKWNAKRSLLTFYFRRSTSIFWTENPYISSKLAALLGGEPTGLGGAIYELRVQCQWRKIEPRLLFTTSERRVAA